MTSPRREELVAELLGILEAGTGGDLAPLLRRCYDDISQQPTPSQSDEEAARAWLHLRGDSYWRTGEEVSRLAAFRAEGAAAAVEKLAASFEAHDCEDPFACDKCEIGRAIRLAWRTA